MQNQALLESVSEIVTLSGDSIQTAVAELPATADSETQAATLDVCQGSVETILMAAEMAELSGLQQLCGEIAAHMSLLNNGGVASFSREYGQCLADWSGAVLNYIQQPETIDLADSLLAPLPHDRRAALRASLSGTAIASAEPATDTSSMAEVVELVVNEQVAETSLVAEIATEPMTEVEDSDDDVLAESADSDEEALAESSDLEDVPVTDVAIVADEALSGDTDMDRAEQDAIPAGPVDAEEAVSVDAEPPAQWAAATTAAESLETTLASDLTDIPAELMADADDDDFEGALAEQLAATFAELEPWREQLISAEDPAKRTAASEGYAEVVERLQAACMDIGLEGFGVLGELINLNVQAIPSLEPEARAAVGEALVEWPSFAIAYLSDPTEESHQMALVQLLSLDAWPEPVEKDQADDLTVALAPDPDGYLADAEQRPTEAQPEDVVLAIAEDVNPKLIEVFLHESPINAADFSTCVELIARGEGVVKNLGSAQRLAHNLKGSANMIGIKGLANMAHHVEDILEYLTEHQAAPQPALGHTLQEAADCIEVMLEALQHSTEPPADAQRILQDVFDWANRMDAGQLEAPVEESTVINPVINESAFMPDPTQVEPAPESTVSEPVAPQPTTPGAASASTSASTPAGKMVRVGADAINAMFRMVGEVSIGLDQLQERFEIVRRHSNELRNQDNVVQQRRFELENFIDVRHVANTQQRLHQLGHHQDFDPLEMDHYDELYSTTRSFIETVADSRQMTQQLRGELTALERALTPLQQMKDDLQETVMKTRMEQVNMISHRLQRSVRQVCRGTGKLAELSIEGGDIQLDSEVLDRLVDPLMHMVRNAVDHGIETAEERAALGKPEVATVRLRFFQEGQNVVVECLDDGRGLNYERIHATAIGKGLLARGATINNQELARLILLPGFSTSDSVTQTSGRGVGMDVVQTAIRELKGVMEIGDNSAATGGCRIALRLPITLMTSHALVVRAGDERYAIPTSSIMQVLSPRVGVFTEIGSDIAYELDKEAYPATTLAACLGLARETNLPNEKSSVVLVYSDTGPVAIAVDQLMNSYHLLLKSLGRYVQSVKGVSGLSSLADGSLIPVLDLGELLRTTAQSIAVPATTTAVAAQAVPTRQTAAEVLIVDDSLSVRQSLKELMEEAGYDTVIARDGMEAVDLLRKQSPSIVLSDIEMPRMNGLELASYIRTTHGANLPIIMITSRTMHKHRQQAEKAGANLFVTKPFDEDALLQSISSLLH